jgi:hypothetical protein
MDVNTSHYKNDKGVFMCGNVWLLGLGLHFKHHASDNK